MNIIENFAEKKKIQHQAITQTVDDFVAVKALAFNKVQ